MTPVHTTCGSLHPHFNGTPAVPCRRHRLNTHGLLDEPVEELPPPAGSPAIEPEREFVSEPFDFDAVYARALRVPLEKIEATVIALEDLIALKRSVARPRDLEDVAALELLTDKAEESQEHPDG